MATSFLDLPGELQVETRDAISLQDIPSHLAFSTATTGIINVYDERFWKRLCSSHGVGVPFPYSPLDRKLSWRETAELVMDYWHADCKETTECKAACRFGEWKGMPTLSNEPNLALNPIFGQIRLNWKSSDPISNAHVFHPRATTEQTSARLGPTKLSHHLGLYSFATSPPTSSLRISFLDLLPRNENALAVSREDGEPVLVYDVLAALHKWMQVPLTDVEKQTIISNTMSRDAEVFGRLAQSTDEDTLAWYWDSRLRFRRDLVGGFSGLEADQNNVVVSFIEGDGGDAEVPPETTKQDKSWLQSRLHKS